MGNSPSCNILTSPEPIINFRNKGNGQQRQPTTQRNTPTPRQLANLDNELKPYNGSGPLLPLGDDMNTNNPDNQNWEDEDYAQSLQQHMQNEMRRDQRQDRGDQNMIVVRLENGRRIKLKPDNEGHIPLNQLNGEENLVYLTVNRQGNISLHGNEGGRIMLPSDDKDRVWFNLDSECNLLLNKQ